MTFEQWMKAVDLSVWRIAGVSVHDLPDCPFRRWWNDGVKASIAAKRALKRAGF
jgi:hypothetical protein